MKAKTLDWRVNTPNMFKEILANDQTVIFTRPLQITARLLAEVAKRASELNDPILNGLMCQLTLYDCADPYSPGYNEQLTRQTIAKAATERLR